MIITSKVAVINPEGDDFLMMLLDRDIVEDLVTIQRHFDMLMVANYAFATIFESSFATGRASGIHRHIKSLEIGLKEVTFEGGEGISHPGTAYPVKAYLSIEISAYERMRSQTPSMIARKDKFPALTIMTLNDG